MSKINSQAHNVAINIDMMEFGFASDRKAVDFNSLSLTQERTKEVQSLPWPFYSVPKEGKPCKTSLHQFGAITCLPETENPVTPSFALFCETGNPFSDKVKSKGNSTAKAYEHHLPFVVAHHVLFSAMLESGGEFSAQDLFCEDVLFARAEEMVRDEMKWKHFNYPRKNFDKNAFAYGLLHFLRDLEICNSLVLPKDYKRNSYTKWQINPVLVDAIAKVGSEEAEQMDLPL